MFILKTKAFRYRITVKKAIPNLSWGQWTEFSINAIISPSFVNKRKSKKMKIVSRDLYSALDS